MAQSPIAQGRWGLSPLDQGHPYRLPLLFCFGSNHLTGAQSKGYIYVR